MSDPMYVQVFEIRYLTEQPLHGDTCEATLHLGVEGRDAKLEDALALFRGHEPNHERVTSIRYCFEVEIPPGEEIRHE